MTATITGLYTWDRPDGSGVPPLLARDARDGTGLDAITEAEIEYMRLLYASGFGAYRIADVFGHDRRFLANVAANYGWRHHTPTRLNVEFGLRVPVLVRCDDCAARFGEEAGIPRPCPHCGSSARGDL